MSGISALSLASSVVVIGNWKQTTVICGNFLVEFYDGETIFTCLLTELIIEESTQIRTRLAQN
jgi:hypothetical protein